MGGGINHPRINLKLLQHLNQIIAIKSIQQHIFQRVQPNSEIVWLIYIVHYAEGLIDLVNAIEQKTIRVTLKLNLQCDHSIKP